MKRDFSRFNAARANRVEHIGREVQPGGGAASAPHGVQRPFDIVRDLQSWSSREI